MGKDWSCGESPFKCFKGRTALIGKVPGGTLVGKTCNWNSDFRISVNETMVEISKPRKDWMSLTFWGSSQSWMIWTLYRAMVRPSRDSMYPRYCRKWHGTHICLHGQKVH